jgi:hypothetical protein
MIIARLMNNKIKMFASMKVNILGIHKNIVVLTSRSIQNIFMFMRAKALL